MSEAGLVRLGESSWCLPGPTNLGLVESGGRTILVDSGNDKESGKKVLRLLEERGWTLEAILNTHSNADHIGGNAWLQEKTSCEVWASREESAFIECPALEPAFLWGGDPPVALHGRFFQAKPSRVTRIIEGGSEVSRLRLIPLPGHFFAQVGVLAPDGVFFLGDGLFGEEILEKHRIPFVQDVAAYRASLARIGSTKASRYVPSHGPVVDDVSGLVAANLGRLDRIEAAILAALAREGSFEDVLASLCGAFGIELDEGRYALIGSTLKTFLTWLAKDGRLSCRFEAGRMLWKTC